MPIVLDERYIAQKVRLQNSGAVVITHQEALKQDIRPARIGLLNLMPAAAMQATENQWLRYISNTVLQVEPVFLKFDNDIRSRQGSTREEILETYLTFSDVTAKGLDALIVTGDNLELRKNVGRVEALPFEEINYAVQLREVIDWARENVFSTIYSCLASQFCLNHLHGVNRTVSGRKIFGVYEHQVKAYSENPILKGLDDVIVAPHSRWGNIETKDLEDSAVEVLASNDEVGWLIGADSNAANGYDIYLQGHPEYDKYDLHGEFMRDWETGQSMPNGYYAHENPASLPKMTWANDARALHSNWIAMIYRHFSGI